MAQLYRHPRFPYGFSLAATAGVLAGFLDRGLSPFATSKPLEAAIVIALGGVIAAAVVARPAGLRLLLPFVLLSGCTAAVTSGYGALRGHPTIFEVVLLVALGMWPLALVLRNREAMGDGSLRKVSPSTWSGIVVYLALTLGLSWVPVFLLGRPERQDELPGALHLLMLSSSYALLMGWQPLVGALVVRSWLEPGWLPSSLRLPRLKYFALAMLAPLGISGVAVMVAIVAGVSSSPPGTSVLLRASQFHDLPLAVAATCGALSLLWIQALAEELGWRGYFLDALMLQVGPTTGLLVHGIVWGLWYAPLFLVANGSLDTGGTSFLTFMVTCMLLGCLLGWLRLVSRSVLSAALANGVLTVCAGLPFLLHGENPGLRGAVYGPPGWVPMVLALGLVMLKRWGAVVSATDRLLDAGSTLVVVSMPSENRQALHEVKPRGEELH